MTFSDRDRKILLILVPLVLIGAFAFLVMKPKYEEATRAANALEAQRERRDQAVAREQQLRVAKQSFAADYTTLVRLGKAVPANVDMPSVLVQLERAARGTKIEFGKIVAGARMPADGGAQGAGASGSGSGAGGSESGEPAAAGGAKAQSAPGQAAEGGSNAAATADQTNAAREGAAAGAEGQTSSSSAQGGPADGGSSSSGGNGASGVEGLDTVPLELSFTGDFFDLADLFHSLKRFVSVANEQLVVRGRLMTIDSFRFASDESFPKIKAEMKARIFLAPQQQGGTAGASPAEPSAASGGSRAAAASTPESPSPTATTPGVATP